MIVDFHTHTLMSDGALSPEALMARALAHGVQCLSITDHDTLGAYRQLDIPQGLDIVPGVEFSCVWSGVTVHIVGLNIDLDNAALQAAVLEQEQAREQRAKLIAERLAKRGLTGMLEAAQAQAGGRKALGRPDFAKAMLARGDVSSIQQAFTRHLGAGKIGDVKSQWPELQTVVGWINGSGGVAVVAHPLHYKLTRTKLRRLLLAFTEAGGRAMEVVNGRQWTQQDLDFLRGCCRELGMLASIGSDFHAENRWTELGCDASLVGDCVPVWQSWQ
ncbi:MAG: putative metal-dependent phosphoesterase TrpH [Bacteroidia bacterium]